MSKHSSISKCTNKSISTWSLLWLHAHPSRYIKTFCCEDLLVQESIQYTTAYLNIQIRTQTCWISYQYTYIYVVFINLKYFIPTIINIKYTNIVKCPFYNALLIFLKILNLIFNHNNYDIIFYSIKQVALDILAWKAMLPKNPVEGLVSMRNYASQTLAEDSSDKNKEAKNYDITLHMDTVSSCLWWQVKECFT